jgi:outer membrane murein-binding lipoprotein Lpp
MIYKPTAAAVVVATVLLAATASPALADSLTNVMSKAVKDVMQVTTKVEKKWTNKRAAKPKLRCRGGRENELSILFEAGKDGSEKGHEVRQILRV